MTFETKLSLSLTACLALVVLTPAGPKDPPRSAPKKCSMSNRPEFALDAQTGKMVPVGPDRWFVECYDVVVVKGKEKILNPHYLKGDLGGYGYYADYAEAAKAAREETKIKQEEVHQ